MIFINWLFWTSNNFLKLDSLFRIYFCPHSLPSVDFSDIYFLYYNFLFNWFLCIISFKWDGVLMLNSNLSHGVGSKRSLNMREQSLASKAERRRMYYSEEQRSRLMKYKLLGSKLAFSKFIWIQGWGALLFNYSSKMTPVLSMHPLPPTYIYFPLSPPPKLVSPPLLQSKHCSLLRLYYCTTAWAKCESLCLFNNQLSHFLKPPPSLL